MKNKKYLILLICVVIVLSIVFGVVMVFSNSGDDTTKDKIKEEVYYIETKLLGMINALNNIPFSNSVLLEQNTIKGQEKSNNSSSGSSSQGSEEKSQGEESSSSSGSSGGESSDSSKSGGDTDYTKYNVQSKNILNLKENEIDWNYIKNTAELLHTSWTTIMIDLHSLNIKNDDILSFSNNLDALILNIEREDKRTTLNSLASLYAIIPAYINQYSDDNYEENLAYTKAYIINSYVLLEDDKWEDMQTEVTKAQEYFNLVINSINTKSSQIFVNKTYVLLNEIKNSINLKDKKLYYMKYKNLMENAMNI